jgi:flagellar basal-body rod protein FlgF
VLVLARFLHPLIRSRMGRQERAAMESTGLILLSRETALQRQVEVLSNNIANANTTGFKGRQVLLQTEKHKPQFNDELNFVLDRATLRDTATGPMVRTGNELDFALQGSGYFGVKTPQGTQYTRAGSFTLNNNGDVVTQEGYQVLSRDGQALNVPVDAVDLSIDGSGRLLTDKGEIGKLQVKTFKREQELQETERGFYQTKEAGEDAADTRIVQGALEQSNVKPVLEMTRVTEAVRAYQQTMTLLQSEHDRLRSAIRTLGRVSQA